MEQIAAAGNTEVPAYLSLQKAGFEVTVSAIDGEKERWAAEKPGFRLVAESPLELLGLWMMRNDRGVDWKASDEEIHSFLKKLYPENP